MNKLVKSVDKKDLVYEFLKSLNGIINVTDRELELLTKFVELDMGHNPALGYNNVTSTDNRRLIRKQLGITPDNLSRYITRFKEKGLLVQGKADDEVYVNKILIPEIIKDRVQLTIILRTNE